VGVGSRGDVAPYVGLGHGPQQRGCQVAIATHDEFVGDLSRRVNDEDGCAAVGRLTA
jgi:UDP:flavonoid glycosyltransferase YjiC (YdhE family)